MEANQCAYAPEPCCYCGHRDTTIWYSLDHRYHRGNKAGDKGYKPYCAHCCEHLALGMLRDVAEILFGRAAADASYRRLLNAIEVRNLNSCEIMTGNVKKQTESMKKQTESMKKQIATALQELKQAPAHDIAARKAYGKIIDQMFDATINPRCVTDEQLRDRIAKLSGLTRKELARRTDVSRITIKGPGVELIRVQAN